MGAKKHVQHIDDDARRVLERLAKLAHEAQQPDRLVPIQMLKDELEAPLEEFSAFTLRKMEQRGAAHLVELEWNGTEKEDLRTDFLSFVRTIVHLPFFYDEIMATDHIEIDLVAGISDDPKDPDTHLLQFRIFGDGVDGLLKSYSDWRASFRWER